MKYLVSVLDDHTGTATPGEMEAIDAFNQRLRAAGHWVFAGGLAAPSTAQVIDNRDGQAHLSPGPYQLTSEYVAGFWIIEVPDAATAQGLASEGSLHCNRKVELRPFLPDPD